MQWKEIGNTLVISLPDSSADFSNLVALLINSERITPGA